MRYDATLKELFQSPPQRLLQLLIGGQAGELLNIEYPAVRMRRPDLLVRLTDGRLYHLELQSSGDADMAWRMLEYFLLIARQFGQSPLQQVLYVGDKPVSLPSGLALDALQYRYSVIYIRDLDAQLLLASPLLEDNLLAILCRVGEAREVIHQIMQRIAGLPDKVQSDTLAKLLILSGLRNWQALVTEEANQMAITLDIEENAFLREVFQDGEQKGINKGEAALLRRQLERRFGPLPEWALQKIEAADTAALETWGIQLLDADRLEDALK